MAEHETFPSFPFYPQNWVTSTATMTAEQKGMFIDLLAYAWDQTPACTLPDDDAILAKLAGVSLQRWRAAGRAVRKKFDVLDGRLCNRKQYTIYCELVEHRARRRVAGQKGNQKRWGSQCDSQSDGNAIAMRSPPSPSPLGPSIEGPSVTDVDPRVIELTRNIGRGGNRAS